MKQFTYYIRIPQDRVTRNTDRNTNFSSTVVTLKDHQNQESMSKFIIHQIFCAPAIGLNTSRDAAKTGEYINNSLHLARKYTRIFVRGHYLFREANSFPRAKLEENCELRGTDNVQGQKSVHIFEAKWMLLCLLSFKYFFTRPQFGRPFLKAFKRQRNYVSAHNIISLFKVFSFIHFNNFLGIKTKRANVNRKVLKLGNITWGPSFGCIT